MHARHYSPITGRLLAVDSLPARPLDPQSWNRYAYVEGSPLSYFDPDGLGKINFVAKIVHLTVDGGRKTIGRVFSREAAMAAQDSGQDILMRGRSAARDIATELGDGKPPIQEVGKGKGQYPHYHPAGRTGGHIFYTAAGVFTLGYYAEGYGTLLEFLAGIGDIFNPLALGQDFREIYETFVVSDEPGGDPIGTMEAYFTLATSGASVQDEHYFLQKLGVHGHLTGQFISTYELFESGALCIEGVCR